MTWWSGVANGMSSSAGAAASSMSAARRSHPEEIETVINRHPAVQGSLVRARRSPITGALVIADVVIKPSASEARVDGDLTRLAEDILQGCRAALRPHKVPTRIRSVPKLDIAATGKLQRSQ